jgi:hypothetical protein
MSETYQTRTVSQNVFKPSIPITTNQATDVYRVIAGRPDTLISSTRTNTDVSGSPKIRLITLEGQVYYDLFQPYTTTSYSLDPTSTRYKVFQSTNSYHQYFYDDLINTQVVGQGETDYSGWTVTNALGVTGVPLVTLINPLTSMGPGLVFLSPQIQVSNQTYGVRYSAPGSPSEVLLISGGTSVPISTGVSTVLPGRSFQIRLTYAAVTTISSPISIHEYGSSIVYSGAYSDSQDQLPSVTALPTNLQNLPATLPPGQATSVGLIKLSAGDILSLS